VCTLLFKESAVYHTILILSSTIDNIIRNLYTQGMPYKSRSTGEMIPDTVLEEEEHTMRNYGRLTYHPPTDDIPSGDWKLWFDDNDNDDNYVSYRHIHELYLDVHYAIGDMVRKIERE